MRTALGIALHGPLPSFLCWGDDLLTFANDAAFSLLGNLDLPCAPAQQLFAPAWEIVGPALASAMDGKAHCSTELALVQQLAGVAEHRPCTFSCTPVRDDSGAVAGVLCTLTENGGRANAIAELKEKEDALRDLSARLADEAAAYAADRDRVWRISQDIMGAASLATGKFLTVNPAFTQTFGWSEEEATSRPFMEMVYPDDREDVALHMHKLATTGEPLVRYDTRVLHKDGSHRWVCWTIVPEGELLYGVARDITAEKQQASALRLAEEALRQSQKMEAVGQLTGGLAHDFNNMLAGVSGHLELMKLRVRLGQSDDLIQRIDSAIGITKRAAALTHRLLAFSRRQALDPKPTRVNELIMSMNDLFRHSTGPSVRILTDLCPSLWTTLCDPNQLENALLNLANNARDAMPGGGDLRIETRNITLCESTASQYGDVAPGEYIAITVSDNGVGMEPSVAARAFDPFFTTKPLGQGTGLGLSMVYGFAQQSGGHVRISSVPGAGTCILLRLPRHMEVATLPHPPEQVDADEGIGGSAVILIVEDETEVRDVMTDALRLQGHTVVAVGDASAALRYLQSNKLPDILVTDIGLPGSMNGRQLADLVRADAPGLPVLLVTGYAEGIVMKNESLPAQMELLIKPFALTSLVTKVGQMTGQRPPQPAAVSL
ncbi:ATP-binding protein [Pseudoduganella sp. GCM10020061]|uniref:hybrid sensor histidine kinase/response regulator n=1 Tax=Pseudoduganella sp. GCM10020061 TaxID=3317345 RepID=UPI003629A8AE